MNSPVAGAGVVCAFHVPVHAGVLLFDLLRGPRNDRTMLSHSRRMRWRWG